jgi:2-methylisocitrate lyase-like PEP mutase family enzyme
MIRINDELDSPTMAIQGEGGKTPMMNVSELEEIGYNVVVYPGSTLFAASWAVRRAMRELIEFGSTVQSIDKMIPFGEFNQLLGLTEIREREDYYYKALSERTKDAY